MQNYQRRSPPTHMTIILNKLPPRGRDAYAGDIHQRRRLPERELLPGAHEAVAVRARLLEGWVAQRVGEGGEDSVAGGVQGVEVGAWVAD